MEKDPAHLHESEASRVLLDDSPDHYEADARYVHRNRRDVGVFGSHPIHLTLIFTAERDRHCDKEPDEQNQNHGNDSERNRVIFFVCSHE